MRRISGEEEGGVLRDLFAKAKLASASLAFEAQRQTIVPQLIAAMQICHDRINIRLNADVLGGTTGQHWNWSIPLPARKPFREAKLRIDQGDTSKPINAAMIALLGDALQARELVLASPELSINQIAKRDGRCRKQLTRQVRLSWLSPNIIEAVVNGRAPSRLTRKRLLDADLPILWSVQEEMLGFAG